jgi:hypothetical protein
VLSRFGAGPANEWWQGFRRITTGGASCMAIVPVNYRTYNLTALQSAHGLAAWAIFAIDVEEM